MGDTPSVITDVPNVYNSAGNTTCPMYITVLGAQHALVTAT